MANDIDISISADNLLAGRHVEFGSTYGETVVYIEPGISGRVSWCF